MYKLATITALALISSAYAISVDVIPIGQGTDCDPTTATEILHITEDCQFLGTEGGITTSFVLADPDISEVDDINGAHTCRLICSQSSDCSTFDSIFDILEGDCLTDDARVCNNMRIFCS